MKTNVVFLTFVAVVLSACSLLYTDGQAAVSVSLALPAGARGSGSRTIPETLDAIYIQALDGDTVLARASSAIAPGAVEATVSMSLMGGSYTVHAFALRNGCIIGVAMSQGVVVQAGRSASIALVMTELYSGEPTTIYGSNPLDPTEINGAATELPLEFIQYLRKGQVELRFRRGVDAPTSWNDHTAAYPATAVPSGVAPNNMLFAGAVPGNVLDWGDQGRVWFTVTWPGCDAIFSFKPFWNADTVDMLS